MNQSWRARYLAFVLAVSFAFVQSVAVSGAPELPNPGNVGVSKQQQEQIGLQAVGEVYKQMPVLPDSSPETQYIRQLGNKLTSVIPQQYSWPWQFHVVQEKDINAFALPGGPMFVNIGTITAAENEAQLAGVMAHEMAHVYMQHSAKQMSKSMWTQGLAGLAGAILGGSSSVWAGLARAGIQIGAGTIMMKYSREDEAQADAVGAIILYKAGYNPQAMADFFRKLAAQGGSSVPQILSDHPNPGNREAAIQKEVANWPSKRYQTNSAAFQKARQQAATVKAYTAQEIADGAKSGRWAQQNQKGGAVVPTTAQTGNNGQQPQTSAGLSLPEVRPSGSFRSLNLGFMSMQYPSNWQESGDQQSQVTIAPSAGVSGNAISYGVVVNAAQPPSGQSMSIDQMTNAIVQNLIQTNQGMQAAGKPQSINVNGVTGRSVDLIGTSPIQGQRERDWLVTLPRNDGSFLFMVFISPERDFDSLRPTYEQMLKSVRLQ